MVFPLTVGRERSRAAAQEAARLQRPLGVLLQSKPEVDEPGPDDLHWVGTTATVLRYITAPDGTHHAICQGVQRFRVLQFLDGYPFMAARVQLIDDPEAVDPDIEGRARSLKQRALEILQLLPQVPAELVAALQGVEGPAQLADFIAGLMDIGRRGEAGAARDLRPQGAARQAARAAVAPHRGAEGLARDRRAHAASRSTSATASTCCASRCARSRRSWAKATRARAEIAELEKAITEAQMPEEVEKQARKELKRLERMPEAAGEYSMVRTYLDWLIELPWSADRATADRHRRGAARSSTTTTTASRRSRSASSSTSRCASSTRRARSPILCFVGPPGVGKTSLGQSIAARDRAQVRARRASAACTTRPRSAATGAPTSARCRATSSRACARPARATA